MNLLASDSEEIIFSYLDCKSLVAWANTAQIWRNDIINTPLSFAKLLDELFSPKKNNKYLILHTLENSNLLSKNYKSLIRTKFLKSGGTIADNIILQPSFIIGCGNLIKNMQLTFSNISCKTLVKYNDIDIIKILQTGKWPINFQNYCMRIFVQNPDKNHSLIISLILLFPKSKFDTFVMLQLILYDKWDLLNFLHLGGRFLQSKFKKLSKISLQPLLKEKYFQGIDWLEKNKYILED